jgi:hypothetical protein
MAKGDPPPTAAYADVVDKLGTIAAPLLGGFSITLLGLVVSKDARATIRWPIWVLATLMAAAVLFLLAVQFTIAGRQFFLTTEEHKAQTPNVLRETRQQAYAAAMTDFRAWATRARIAFDAGLAALLLALVGVALPPGKVSHFGIGRWFALGIASVAFIGEVWWLTKDEWRTAQWNQLIRRGRDVPAPPEETKGPTVPEGERDQESEIASPGSAAIRGDATRANSSRSTAAGPVQPSPQRDVSHGTPSRPASSDESARPPPVWMSDGLADARAHAEFQARRNCCGIGASVTRVSQDGEDRTWQCVISDGHNWHYIRLIGEGRGRFPNFSPVAVEESIYRFAESLPESGRLWHLLNANPLRMSPHGIVRD